MDTVESSFAIILTVIATFTLLGGFLALRRKEW